MGMQRVGKEARLADWKRGAAEKGETDGSHGSFFLEGRDPGENEKESLRKKKRKV